MSEFSIGRFGLRLSHEKEIEALLASVNGRATRWTIGTVSEVRIAADKAEQQLARASLPQKDRIGATAFVTAMRRTAPHINTAWTAPVSIFVAMQTAGV